MSTTQPRLLLIEDDRELGPLIRGVLEATYHVELVADGQAGLDLAIRVDFDVLVIDRRLPTLDGLSVVQALRAHHVTTPILLLTALGTIADKVDGLDAGANDYLVKPFDFDELLARLRALTREFTSEGPAVDIGEWTFYPDDHSIHSPHIGRILLTPRESDLLRLFATQPDRTFSREQVLHTVFQVGEQPGTVDTYVHYLRRKTDKDIVLTVRGRGYRLGQL
ncbi:response regulator transcription factor [Glaciibacter psychrotolerans]|uniref:Two-component system response regulator QseB n=1 Tax=Glaciibacter psychrotolerans TaxID=670054 RepID=A0A7Z0ED86_9MICO|nr:response regulator transcription factor [Leifsonia psychrotolerans]NYJ19511.1 two-component system response regulator QseB [Leifsonia psychrotolerans]